MKTEAAVKCAYSQMMPIEQIIPNPRNPNTHPAKQITLLGKVIKAQGWRSPITVSNLSGFIVRGHARLEAAHLIGCTQCPVDFQDYDTEAQEWADMIADNKIAELAELDPLKLKDILGELDLSGLDMDLTGFGGKEIDELMAQFFVPNEGLTDEDEVPNAPEEPICNPGDLWQLGKHRLLCGNATVVTDVERLMGGEEADMVFTDPPYGIGYEYISHDDADNQENALLVEDAFNLFSCGKVWTCGKMNLARDITRFGEAKVVVWYKKFAQAGSGLGGASTWEPVLVVSPKIKQLNNDVLEIPTDREPGLREKHSCPKPVALYVELIKSFSNSNCNIVDPFGGSGSTLIACEKLGRRCFIMEIESRYCDVIVKRWEQYTGKNAVLSTEVNVSGQ